MAGRCAEKVRKENEGAFFNWILIRGSAGEDYRGFVNIEIDSFRICTSFSGLMKLIAAMTL